jgi:hypothetical protein
MKVMDDKCAYARAFFEQSDRSPKETRAETQKSCILIENYRTDVKNVTAPSAVKYKKKPEFQRTFSLSLPVYRGIQPLSHEESQNVTSCHSCHSHCHCHSHWNTAWSGRA